MLPAILILLVLAMLYFIMRRKSHGGCQIVRFARPSCRYCVQSQPEWNAFKQAAHGRPFEVVDVNIEDGSDHTRRWLAKHKVDGVPKVIRIRGGDVQEYTGDRTRLGYMKFAMG